MNAKTKWAAMMLAWLIAVQPYLYILPVSAKELRPAMSVQSFEQDSVINQLSKDADLQSKGVELTGHYDDSSADRVVTKRKPGFGEDGSPANISPFASLPIVDQKLSSRAAAAKASDVARVIVHLNYLPHAEVFDRVYENYRQEADSLELERQTLGAELNSLRRIDTKVDAEDYRGIHRMNDTQRATMKRIAQRNEDLSFEIKQDITAMLRPLIEASQAPVHEAIERLGGNVEFSTIAGNMVIATMPLKMVETLGQEKGILRIVEDHMMEGHLLNAPASTMVNPADTSLLGLWDQGNTGGIYDPAIIDSGTDLAHPFMANSATPLRDNFGSWYLVAANGSSSFGDIFSQDDLQGHGTHVAGIVGSKGSAIYPGHLGMAHGVEKLVTLKAGWLNSSSGTASMFWSDKYFLVERAINNNNSLMPGSTFLDDVDGFNLSYGGSTTLDDTDGSRFWDSVISTFADTPVTISAGNSGPVGTIGDPAIAYNVIAVANLNDKGTSSRADDSVNSSSSTGPTANGRKKPDLAAPGTTIASANNDWESETDWIDKSGTSMAAPMVLGVIMDLMDASLFDELSIKAVLINTAQKNLASANFENDSDGWDPQLGWGVMNAYAAFQHRFDVFKDFLDPRDINDNHESNDYQLYKGVMRDEGAAGEGRDKATMVWNRKATYLANNAPSTFFTLTDMNLRLYNETNNSLIDSELGVADNVHQVRINAGASDTDVVVKAYTWSSAFSHGGATEEIAVSMEEGFTRVDFPTQFQGIAIWPTEVEPNEIFDITFYLRNDSEVASHNNTFNLALPTGFTLLAGIDTQNVGSASVGGITSMVTYTMRAPSTAVGAQTVVVAHSHNSYLESYGNFNWNMSVTVAVDTTPPNPNPMDFSTLPDDASQSSIDMTALTASDLHNPVQYYLDYTSSPTGGFGGSDSGWQGSRSFEDGGLQANHSYCYRAWARDAATFPNLTTPSASSCAYTAQIVPTGVNLNSATATSIAVTPSGSFSNLTFDSSGVSISNLTQGTSSGFQQNTNAWNSAGLTPATKYSFSAVARNGDADVTAASPDFGYFTLANPPAVDALTTTSDQSIQVALDNNGNGPDAQYFIQNTSNGTDSGWISALSYEFSGLTCETFYNFQAKARNGEDVESITVPLGLQTTGACGADADNDGVNDDVDNCTLVSNPTQLDTNGDGYGNACDPDLDNNGIVNFLDVGQFASQFGFVGVSDADFDGSGVVNFLDYAKFPVFIFGPPGPSGVAP